MPNGRSEERHQMPSAPSNEPPRSSGLTNEFPNVDALDRDSQSPVAEAGPSDVGSNDANQFRRWHEYEMPAGALTLRKKPRSPLVESSEGTDFVVEYDEFPVLSAHTLATRRERRLPDQPLPSRVLVRLCSSVEEGPNNIVQVAIASREVDKEGSVRILFRQGTSTLFSVQLAPASTPVKIVIRIEERLFLIAQRHHSSARPGFFYNAIFVRLDNATSAAKFRDMLRSKSSRPMRGPA